MYVALTKSAWAPTLHRPASLHIHQYSPAINFFPICVLVCRCNRLGGVSRGKGRANGMVVIHSAHNAHPPPETQTTDGYFEEEVPVASLPLE